MIVEEGKEQLDAMEIKKLQGAIEAILFTMGESVDLGRIAAAIEHDEETTRKIIHNMMDSYDAEDRGIRILELEGSFQMCTKKELYEYLIRVAKQPKRYVLTDVMLETLSIVAYKQPVTRLEIEKIRGVKSDHAVNKLVEYGLIEEVGRLDAPGRPLQFGTTEEFFRRFDLQSLDELPTIDPEQIEHFKEEAEDEAQLQLDI
jgi:segregation and condensation protein B